MCSFTDERVAGFWHVDLKSVEEQVTALTEIAAAGLRIAEIVVALPTDEMASEFIDGSELTWNQSYFCDDGPQMEQFEAA